MEFNLTEEQNLLIDTTKSFVKAELLQHEELLEKTNNLPKELYDEIKQKSIKQVCMLAICPLNMVVVV